MNKLFYVDIILISLITRNYQQLGNLAKLLAKLPTNGNPMRDIYADMP